MTRQTWKFEKALFTDPVTNMITLLYCCPYSVCVCTVYLHYNMNEKGIFCAYIRTYWYMLVNSLLNLRLVLCIYLQLETLRCVGSMAGLTTLNISNCLKINNIQEVQKCSSLQCLSLAGLKLSHEALTAMQGEYLVSNVSTTLFKSDACLLPAASFQLWAYAWFP